MRDAALTIAALGDDFAPSLLARARRAVEGLAAEIRGTRLARRHLRHLGRLDARLLADIGLAPDDLAAIDPALSPREATRRLADAARHRRAAAAAAAAAAEERWHRL